MRQADELVGLLVVVAIALFLAAVLQAGVLRDWLRPTATLRVLLPDAGVGGLSVGADMEVLGTRAGTVRRMVIDPEQRMYAEVQVEDQARVFIRRDSTAVIRKRFGVAGAAYLDVQRGTGAPLDWDFAVIEATTERAPTETMGALFDELSSRIFPILDDAQRGIRAMASALEAMERGEGSIGRLIRDDSLAVSVEGIAAEARTAVAQFAPLIETLARVAREGEALVAGFNTGGGPGARVDAILADVQRLTRELGRAAPRVQPTVRNAQEASANLPALLLQTQQTARELEALLTQLRGLWLLGGGGPPAAAPPLRPPTERLRP
jgi:phospholipid/cholesterol/gamma-HCH transport system substrate-binding protein